METILQSAAAAALSTPTCDCSKCWRAFKASPDFPAYNSKYGNYPGKPGETNSDFQRSSLRGEMQQGKFNDVNEVGTESGVIKKMRTKDKKKEVDAVAPPGWEGTVKHMKSHPEITNPWALAWYMKNKGDTPRK